MQQDQELEVLARLSHSKRRSRNGVGRAGIGTCGLVAVWEKAVDLYGPVDTRPGTYGHADYVVWNQTFTNVPAGCRVQILHIDGDFIAWPKGTVAAGSSVGVVRPGTGVC